MSGCQITYTFPELKSISAGPVWKVSILDIYQRALVEKLGVGSEFSLISKTGI